MPFQPSEIGKIYDLGVSLRDPADSLTVKDANGSDVVLKQVALMQVNDEQQAMTESTNLQRKDLLVSSASPNLVDRMEEWPQVSQGDWSGGIGQRVFIDTTKYAEGLGVVWPVTDIVPQRSLQKTEKIVVAGGTVSTILLGPEGGSILGGGGGYAWVTSEVTGGVTTWVVHYQSGDTEFTGTYAAGVVAQFINMTVGDGRIWITLVKSAAPKKVQVDSWWIVGGVLTLVNVSADVGIAYNGLQNGGGAKITLAGNAAWFGSAFFYVEDVTGTLKGVLVLIDLETNAITTQALPNDPRREAFGQMAAQGSQFILTFSDGSQATATAFDLVTTTFSTLVILNNCTALGVAAVGEAVVLLALQAPSATLINYEIYVLTGGALTPIGSLTVPGSVTVLTPPQALGPYVVWAITSPTIAPYGFGGVDLYMFDPIRLRLFHADTAYLTVSQLFTISSSVARIACFPPQARTVNGLSVTASGGVALLGQNTFDSSFWKLEFYWAPILPAGGGSIPTRQTCQLQSSLIDLTSAENKLYRQVVVSHDPLVAGAEAQVEVWFDQDPYNLGAVADFTSPLNSTVGSMITRVILNKMARKLVYRVTTFNSKGVSGGVLVQAPKIQAVAVQAATGWVWEMVADLTPSALVNTLNQQDYCFKRQGIDHVAAYNFLRLLWRERGGECILNLANGDQYNGLMQLAEFPSPKHLASGTRSDQPRSWQTLAHLKLREDA